jgi:putative membrane protein
MNRRAHVPADLAHVARGLLMGGADIVPGVSGGTVALVLGIYERLVTALSHFDLVFLGLVRRGLWGDAAARVDLRFLAALGLGILTGIVSLASLTNRLLTDAATRPYALAAFFGLITASAILVVRRIDGRRTSLWPVLGLLALGGAVAAYWFTGLGIGQAEVTYPYVFLCGAVAICAMILPGVSGAFLLLVLGVYIPVTDILRRLPRGQVAADDLLILATLAAGCAVGLIAFSRLLRWLLARQQPQTMALLFGLMLGSLRALWPFQRDVTLDHLDRLPGSLSAELRADPDALARLDLKYHVFVNSLPQRWSMDDVLVVAVALAAAALVLLLDWFAGRTATAPPLEADKH